MKIKMTVIAIILSLVMCLCACGNSMKKYAGTYMGDSGSSSLTLNEDGTATYSQNDSVGTGTGAWKIEDKRIVVSVTNLSYDIYADIIDDEEFLFYADEGERWYDEVFTKYN